MQVSKLKLNLPYSSSPIRRENSHSSGAKRGRLTHATRAKRGKCSQLVGNLRSGVFLFFVSRPSHASGCDFASEWLKINFIPVIFKSTPVFEELKNTKPRKFIIPSNVII